jgi:hypothetical protein
VTWRKHSSYNLRAPKATTALVTCLQLLHLNLVAFLLPFSLLITSATSSSPGFSKDLYPGGKDLEKNSHSLQIVSQHRGLLHGMYSNRSFHNFHGKKLQRKNSLTGGCHNKPFNRKGPDNNRNCVWLFGKFAHASLLNKRKADGDDNRFEHLTICDSLRMVSTSKRHT